MKHIITIVFALCVFIALGQQSPNCWTASSFVSVKAVPGQKNLQKKEYSETASLCMMGDNIAFHIPVNGYGLRVLKFDYVGTDTIGGFHSSYLSVDKTMQVDVYGGNKIWIQFLRGDGELIILQPIKHFDITYDDYVRRYNN